ncbi:Hypothetical protein R9X50_00436900 [Acrodontium crateriforme]|uniref:Uncharacterized protein n=1 Tax=Acrodontium crateriforme TaxID=150365 RepID=A0AAQ3M7J5_9PEZI|nr:Hypothetical protein R9X50_00436900 [Acrodontium crateriforme]
MASAKKWNFLNLSDPQDLKDRATQKKIRSHVTSRQHAKARKAAKQQALSVRPRLSAVVRAVPSPSSVKASGSHPPPYAKPTSVKSTQGALDDQPESNDREITTSEEWNIVVKRPKQPIRKYCSRSPLRVAHSRQPSPATSSDSTSSTIYDSYIPIQSRSQSPPLAAFNFHTPLYDPAHYFHGATNFDPFSSTPVQYLPWYGWLTDYWYGRTLPRSNKLLKASLAQINVYTLWARRLEMEEPALYYMALLLASGIPVAEGTFPLYKALWLRGKVITAINEALADPNRATSTPVIMAVGQIALHEHIYGDRAAAHRSHRPAQQQMIALRGGIFKMGLPPIVMQIMVWYDKLMAAEGNNVAYFSYIPEILKIPGYDDAEATAVTNYSSPSRYKHPGYASLQELDELPLKD